MTALLEAVQLVRSFGARRAVDGVDVDLAPGVLWVTFTFCGLLGMHRSFRVEAQDGAMDALLVSPVAREAIFLGKGLANLLFVLGVQAIALPFFVPIVMPAAQATARLLAGRPIEESFA